jgi:hypothetical protein
MNPCLTQGELAGLLDYKLRNNPIEEEILASRVALAENWTESLGAFTYLLSRILESRADEGIDCIEIVNCFYNLPDNMYLFIQELDFDFVSCMVRLVRNPALSIEDEIIQIQEEINNHYYVRLICY